MEKEVIIIDDPSEVCPACESLISSSLIQGHVENHFKSDPNPILGAKEWRICQKCQNNVLVLEWADHIYAHELQETKSCTAGVKLNKISVTKSEGCSSKTVDVNGDMNDSALACALQEEEGMSKLIGTSNDGMNDSVLAYALQQEEKEHLRQGKQKEQEEFQRLQSLYGMNSKTGYEKQFKQSIDKDISTNKLSIADYYSKKENMLDALITGEDSGESCTKGVIERLRQHPGSSGSQVMLCSPTDHFATSYGDKHWGCGYRNLQMLLSALLKIHHFQTTIQKVCKNVPSIPKIQHIIEDAWKAGYDKQGAAQLGHKLTKTKKWIGATDIATALRFIGLRANIVDFHRPTSSDGRTHSEMFTWIKTYFNQSSSTNYITPLYLQHQGHSRSVVGFEEKLNKNRNQSLLLFDPSHSPKQMQSLCTTEKQELKLLRKSLKQMSAQQYQLVYVNGIMGETEQKESKILTSVRIP